MNNLNILHYTFGLPPKATGGLPLYVKDLSESQKKAGHIVNILLPKQRIIGKDKIYKKNGIYYINNSLPVSSVFGMKNPNDYMRSYSKDAIYSFLTSVHPDIIHIHTLMGLPKEFLEIAKDKNIKIIYTTHDFYGLCLKCNFIDANGRVCENHDCVKCTKCNMINGLDNKIPYLIATNFYRRLKKNKLINFLKVKYRNRNIEYGHRKTVDKHKVTSFEVSKFEELLSYYRTMFSMIDKFHFNSSLTKQVFESYLSNITGKVISITLEHIKDCRNLKNKKIGDKIIFGYIGRTEPYKGLDMLMNALKKIDDKGYDFECLLYGDDFTLYDNLLNGKIKNMGIYKNNELLKVFNSFDVLIVPSICKETFGFIVLEALSYGTPVVVSENTGSKDLIKHDFEKYITTNDSIIEIILEIINNSTIIIKYSNMIKNIDIDFDIHEHEKKLTELYLNL